MRTVWLTLTHLITNIKTATFITALTALLVLPALSDPTIVHASGGINNTRGDAWGTLEVSGTDPNNLGGGGVNIYSNGPQISYTPNKPNNSVNGVVSGEEWQCVELINRLYLTKSWITATWTGNGGQLYDNAPSSLSSYKELNGSITYLNPGDTLILQDSGAGHAALINTYNSGTGAIQIESQNTDQVYDTTFSLSNKTISSTGWGTYSVKGIVHHPTQGNTPNPNDFDNDDHTDLMFLHKLSDNASANMYIYNQSDSFASPGLIRNYLASSGWNWNNMKIATGDANNDGISDLFMLHKLSDGGANLYVFYGGTSGFGDSSPVLQLPGTSGWSWDSMKLLVGDYDNDQRADVMILHKLADNGANLYVFTKASNFVGPGLVRTFPASSGWNWNNMKVASGDVNHDGVSDLFMLHKLSDGGANLYVFYGGQFTLTSPVRTLAGASGWSWDRMKAQTGDFDNDHRADLILLHELSDNASANVYVFTATSGFAIPSVARSFQASSGWNWNLMKLSTGDVDNDGYSDLFMLHKLGDGGANFYAFRGGTGQLADSSPLINFPGTNGWSWDKMLAPLYVQ